MAALTEVKTLPASSGDLGSGIWDLGSGIWDLGSGIWDLDWDSGSIRFQSSSILRYNSIPHFGERVSVMDLIGIKTTNTAPKVCTVHIRG